MFCASLTNFGHVLGLKLVLVTRVFKGIEHLIPKKKSMKKSSTESNKTIKNKGDYSDLPIFNTLIL